MFSGMKGLALPEEERLPQWNFPPGWGLTFAGNSFDLRFDCDGNLRPGAEKVRYSGPRFGPITRELLHGKG